MSVGPTVCPDRRFHRCMNLQGHWRTHSCLPYRVCPRFPVSQPDHGQRAGDGLFSQPVGPSQLYFAHHVADVGEPCYLGFGEWVPEVH